MILEKIRQHRLAYLDFIRWLIDEKVVTNVEIYLKLQDKLAYGVILEYIHHKGCNLLLSTKTAGVILNKKGSPYFGSKFEHKGLSFIFTFTSKNDIPFKHSINIAIEGFFEELDSQLNVI